MILLKRKLNNLILKTKTYPLIENLLKFFAKTGGRNFKGKRHITMRTRMGGVKKKYRMLDFKRKLWNLSAKILRFEYDPYRTSLISLICYSNGILSYILKTENTFRGQRIWVGDLKRKIEFGNTMPLYYIPEGSFIHNIECFLGFGGVLCRSAGTFAIVMRKFIEFNNENKSKISVLIRLPSREEILINGNCIATIGITSNINYKFVSFYKAGQKRLLGFKPKVRGVAKNPIDHPHGGGGGRCLVTALGKVAKNKPTRKKGRRVFTIITSRKKVRRRKK